MEINISDKSILTPWKTTSNVLGSITIYVIMKFNSVELIYFSQTEGSNMLTLTFQFVNIVGFILQRKLNLKLWFKILN